MFDGPPMLAVEILSPNESIDLLEAKLRDDLESGVSLVWVVSPSFKTVTVDCRERSPQMVTGQKEITADPHLPEFRVPVFEFFQMVNP